MRGWVLALVGVGLPLLVMLAAWRVWLFDSHESISAPIAASESNVPHQEQPIRTPHVRHGESRIRRTSGGPSTQPQPPTGVGGSDNRLEFWSEQFERFVESFRASGGMGEPLAAASALLREGEYQWAVDAFDRLLVRSPNDPALLFGKAMSLSGAGRFEDALPLLEKVIELEPGNVPARFNLAVTLVRVGQTPAATIMLENIVREEPTYWPAKFNLAILHQASGKLNEAAVLWRELTETGKAESKATPMEKSRVVDAWFHRGETAILLHLSDEAEQSFKEVLKANPNDARAWCNIGIARAAAGRRVEAIGALNEALKLDPKLVAAINQLAMVHAANYRDAARLEDRQRVLDFCRQSLAINPRQLNMSALRDAILKE